MGWIEWFIQFSDNSDYGSLLCSFIILGIQGGCFHTILSWNGWRGKKCNIGEVSSLHILVMGNVITVRLQEGDYGNPFVLNYMPEWGNGRPSRLKICRLQRRASSTLASGTKKDKINLDNSKKIVIFVLKVHWYCWFIFGEFLTWIKPSLLVGELRD